MQPRTRIAAPGSCWQREPKTNNPQEAHRRFEDYLAEFYGDRIRADFERQKEDPQ